MSVYSRLSLRGLQVGPRLGRGGVGLGDLRVQHVQLLARGFQPCIGGDDSGAGLRVQCVGALRILTGAGGGLRQAAIAGSVRRGEVCLGRFLGEGALLLADGGLLQHVLRAQRVECRGARGDHSFRVVQGGAVVSVVQADQRLAGLHELVVGHQHLRDETADMRRNRGDVAADIGVVGGLDEAPLGPPVVTVPACAGDGDGQRGAGYDGFPCAQQGAVARRGGDGVARAHRAGQGARHGLLPSQEQPLPPRRPATGARPLRRQCHTPSGRVVRSVGGRCGDPPGPGRRVRRCLRPR